MQYRLSSEIEYPLSSGIGHIYKGDIRNDMLRKKYIFDIKQEDLDLEKKKYKSIPKFKLNKFNYMFYAIKKYGLFKYNKLNHKEVHREFKLHVAKQYNCHIAYHDKVNVDLRTCVVPVRTYLIDTNYYKNNIYYVG